MGENPSYGRQDTSEECPLAKREKLPLASTKKFVLKAVQQLKNNLEAHAGLMRIANSVDAIEILAGTRLTETVLNSLLESFARAVHMRRSFSLLILESEEFLLRKSSLLKSVADLQVFVDEMLSQKDDDIRAKITFSQQEGAEYRAVLYNIKNLIDNRTRIALETPIRIGATQKRNGEIAAENAGIGQLADSIERIAPNTKVWERCRLAEALFDITEVTEDRLRGAEENARRQWRQPLF